jgi:hypothetical protein
MKKIKITTGGKIIGAIELLISIGLIAIYIIASDDVRMERFMDDRATTFPVLCLIAGGFKLVGVLLIWFKQKIGVGFYIIGNLTLIIFLFILSSDFEFSYMDELIPILILYVGIALEVWFGFIMSKAIKIIK